MDNLLDLLNSSNESDRVQAINLMIRSNNVDYAKPILDRLDNEISLYVKENIFFALKKLKSKNVYEKMFELFHHEDPMIRNSAVATMREYVDDYFVDFLFNRMDNSNEEVRKLILDVLVSIPSPKVVSVFYYALKDSSINVVITAVEYLGKVVDKNCSEKLIELYRDTSDFMLKTSILESMIAIGSTDHIKKLIPYIDTYPLFISYLIRLNGIVDNLAEVLGILEKKTTIERYIEETLFAFEKMSNLNHAEIFIILKYIYESKKVSEKSKFQAIVLLAKIQSSESNQYLNQIIQKTDDLELKEFIQNLMEKH